MCLDYLDDVIVTGRTFSEHLANLQKVITCLDEAGLRLKKPQKCFFTMREVGYLGYVYLVSVDGISDDLLSVSFMRLPLT